MVHLPLPFTSLAVELGAHEWSSAQAFSPISVEDAYPYGLWAETLMSEGRRL